MNIANKKTDRKNVEDILSLTPVQEGMLFFYLEDPTNTRNFEQLVLEISGDIDYRNFKKAWQLVIDANEMLRTAFRWEKVKKPVQMVLRKHTPDLRFFDLTGTPGGIAPGESETLKRLQDIKKSDRNERFDLQEVPFRVTLCKTGGKKYSMIVSNHHILYDGWSNGIILKEFFNTYSELVRGGIPEKPVKTGFKHFIQWLRSRDTEQQKAFWKGYLADFENTSPYQVRQKKSTVTTGILQFKFPAELNSKITDFVLKHKITFPALLYSAWGLLLQQYNRSGDILFDTTVSGRSARIKGIEEMVGLFINTLPVRVNTRSHESLIEILCHTKQILEQLEEFENTSLAVIDEYLEACVNPVLFHSVLVIENYPLDVNAICERSGLYVDAYSNIGTTGYDLTVLITTSGGKPDSPVGGVEFIYNADLFNQESAALVKRHFLALLETVVTNPQGNTSELNMTISEEEKDKIVSYFVRDRETGSETGASYAVATVYEAPRNSFEEKLVEIWLDVLRLPRETLIGIDDNFFAFGGHSLKASLLAARLHKEFNARVPLVEIFHNPTIRQLALYVERASCDKDEDTCLPLQTVEPKEYYPSASVQQRVYALQQLDPDSTAYNVSTAMVVEGGLDLERLEEVFKTLIRRHESLRTSFLSADGELVQKIHESVEFTIQFQDNVPASHELSIKDIIKDFIRPFDLSLAPLLRVGLVKTAEAGHLLILDMHHIITDGVSMDLFIKEFTALYKGDDRLLLPLTLQYKDFAQWQNDRLKSGELKPQEEYWLSRLSGELPVLDLQTDFPRPAIQSFEGKRLSFCLDDRLTRGIHKLAEETGTTFFIVLLAALNVLLTRNTGQEDIIVGTTVAGRNHADLQRIVGLFIETLALRNYPDGSKIFADFLKEVGDNTLTAFENDAYPFRELMKLVGDPGEVTRNPLFTVMLIVQNIDMAPLEIEGLNFTPVDYFSPVSKVDMTFEVFETESPVRVELEYCTALFREETAARLAGHFVNILKDVIDNPGKSLSDIAMLGDFEVSRILEDFAGKGSRLPGTEAVMVHQLFENQVRQAPADIAVVYKETQLTYKELNERADALSAIIKEL